MKGNIKQDLNDLLNNKSPNYSLKYKIFMNLQCNITKAVVAFSLCVLTSEEFSGAGFLFPILHNNCNYQMQQLYYVR